MRTHSRMASLPPLKHTKRCLLRKHIRQKRSRHDAASLGCSHVWERVSQHRQEQGSCVGCVDQHQNRCTGLTPGALSTYGDGGYMTVSAVRYAMWLSRAGIIAMTCTPTC